jgi:hypothetical protein
VAADMPQANRLTIRITAVMAEDERAAVSQSARRLLSQLPSAAASSSVAIAVLD